MAGGETAALPAGKRKTDLGVRTVSALVMTTVAGTALWLGGIAWISFVALIALGVCWEWRSLVVGFVASPVLRGLWDASGIIYVGGAACALAFLRQDVLGTDILLVAVAAVIATDIGAYFAGRTIGGPKIAPKISPSKTWAGLAGGIAGASLVLLAFSIVAGGGHRAASDWLHIAIECLLGGLFYAVIAQAGDFFESWMKRRAGVKDSGRLLPGHGGLFDRVDGLLAVMFVTGIYIVVLHAMTPP